nr:hypothetical protein [Tanacetum cinerariifolium]
MDEALVPHAQRLRIKRSNFRLLSDIKSKATTTVHHYAIRLRMDNKKHIVNFKSFRDMIHICLRVHSQSFAEPPFEDKIISFICFLGHNAVIRRLTIINIKKLYQPWRSFTAIINKCLIGKSFGYDSLRISQAQILSNIKILRRAMRCIILGSRRLSSTISCQKLTNVEIKNSNAYKEYYAIATGATPPKPKASVRRTKSSFDTTITPPTTAAGPRLTTSQKGVLDVPSDESEEELSWNSTDDDGDDDERKDGDGDEENDGDDGEEGYGDNDDEDDDGEESDDDDDDD